jgi:protein-S-isoprenylcysteine O-methyltransferase Ste14
MAVFGLAFAVAVALEWWAPLPPPTSLLGTGGFWMGLAAVAAGTLLVALCLAVFRRLGTGIMPNRPARHLVTFGPYGWSRNPMFVAFVLIYTGCALLLDSTWALAFGPIAIAITTATVVRREESYLRTVFGDDYDRYAKQVHRWLGRRIEPSQTPQPQRSSWPAARG